MTETEAAQYWETRYADASRVWSGRPNQALVDLTGGLPPGRALDLGCGEGGDAIWLATQGWQVTGVDIARTAISRAEAAAASARVPEGRIRWLVRDLAAWAGDESYDLVSACFLQSWFEFPRTDILRRAAGLVTNGGHLLIVSHAQPPPWADLPDGHGHSFPAPADDLCALDLSELDWEVLVAEIRSRAATGPHAQHGTVTDGIVLVRRR